MTATTPLTPFLKNFIDKNCITFERMIMVAMAQSYRFWREHRETISPFNPETVTNRNDFRTQRYNILYRQIDRYWRLNPDETMTEPDYIIPQDELKAFLIDDANNGAIEESMAKELLEEIDADIYKSQVT